MIHVGNLTTLGELDELLHRLELSIEINLGATVRVIVSGGGIESIGQGATIAEAIDSGITNHAQATRDFNAARR